MSIQSFLKEAIVGDASLMKSSGLALLPLLSVALVAIVYSEWSAPLRLTIGLLTVLTALAFTVLWNKSTGLKLQNLENLLLSLRDEDYTARLQEGSDNDQLTRTLKAANRLSAVLRDERTGVAEYSALLSKVIEQINVGVVAFDKEGAISLISDRCCDIFQQPRKEVLRMSAQELGLENLLFDQSIDTWSPSDNRDATYQVRRSNFRERGKERILITLTDVSQPLRRQELLAWQKIVKVLRHEMSNSLAPIQSYVQLLQSNLKELGLTDESAQLFAEGFDVIGNRCKALVRLTDSYRSLTDLPEPARSQVDVDRLIEDTITLFTDRPIDFRLNNLPLSSLDRDQMQQVLVNLLNNADEAMTSKHKPIVIRTSVIGDGGGLRKLCIKIEDSGPGIGETENLFVPFYTTKAEGEGIGLALSRLIIERHGGSLQLKNRSSGGAMALIIVPVESP